MRRYRSCSVTAWSHWVSARDCRPSTASAPIFEALNAQIGWRPALAMLLLGYAALGWLVWSRLPTTSVATEGRRPAARIPLWHMLRRDRLRWALIGVLAATPLGSASFAAIGQLSREFEPGFGASFAIVAVSLMALGNGVGRLGFGILADTQGARFSRNAVLALNALAGLLCLTALYGAARPLFAIYPLFIGLSFGGIAGKLPALAAHVVEHGHADSAFGLLFGTFALASFLGPLLGATAGMHAALTILAACALGACLPALFGR
ncbi:MAG: MFS transporter [Acidihalobacter sp.]